VAEGGGGCVSKTRIKEEIIKIKIKKDNERGRETERKKERVGNHAYFMVHCNAVAADRELLLHVTWTATVVAAAASGKSGKSWMSPTIGLFRLRLH